MKKSSLINLYDHVFTCVDFYMILLMLVSVEELAQYLDLKKIDEMVYMFEAVSLYDG